MNSKYKEEDKKFKKGLSTANITSLVSLCLRARRAREERLKALEEKKKPHLLELQKIEGEGREYCEKIEAIEKEILQKLLTFKKEGLIIGNILRGKEGGKIVFSEREQVEIPHGEKIFRNNEEYSSIPDQFFMLDMTKVKRAVLSEEFKFPSFVKKPLFTVNIFTNG